MERRRIERSEESHVSFLETRLNERIIGQPDAIRAIMTAMENARLREEGRPVASLMFLGPTGTGKTQTAEVLADEFAYDKLHPNMIKVDGGQFAQSHETAALLGAPPGYVGREQDPILDPDVIEQPGSVLLFDEIEKAHPKVHNLLLQIMDKGKVKLLNSGREVNFNNCTLIMTSNVGAQDMQDAIANRRIGFAHDDTVAPEKVAAAGTAALRRQFSPEFINRLDGVITFNSLSDEQLMEVLDTHVEQSNHRYQRLGNVALRLSKELKTHLVTTAADRKEYGFRPVKRNFEREVQAPTSGMVAKQEVGGTYLLADYEDNEVTFYEDGPLLTVEDILALAPSNWVEDDELLCETDEQEVL